MNCGVAGSSPRFALGERVGEVLALARSAERPGAERPPG